MTVILNEVALRVFLESEQGPVGRDLRDRAERVREKAQANLRVIIANPLVRPQADFSIGSDAQRLFAVVGIRDEGRVARYLAEKESRERVWLVPALAEAV